MNRYIHVLDLPRLSMKKNGELFAETSNSLPKTKSRFHSNPTVPIDFPNNHLVFGCIRASSLPMTRKNGGRKLLIVNCEGLTK